MTYRRINRIPDDWGTAVNVQQMVFGNKGDTSGSGVAFSRDEVTGEPEPSGDFLAERPGRGRRLRRAQHRATSASCASGCPRRTSSSWRSCARSSATTRTCRTPSSRSRRGASTCCRRASAKRPAQAAVRFACDAVDEGLLTKAEALATIDAENARRAAAPDLRPRGRVRRSSPAASRRRRARRRARSSSPPTTRCGRGATGRDVILVRPFTEADDVAGFHAREGHPHQRGRQGLARGARRARHGRARRHRRGRAADRPDAPATVRVDDTVLQRGRPDRHRRHDRLPHHRRRAAHRARGLRGVRARARAGPTSCARSACARTPTRPRTRARRASSAPRASACAAPSTCSSARTATRAMVEAILAESDEDRKAALDRAAPAPAGRLRGACSRRWRACR